MEFYLALRENEVLTRYYTDEPGNQDAKGKRPVAKDHIVYNSIHMKSVQDREVDWWFPRTGKSGGWEKIRSDSW